MVVAAVSQSAVVPLVAAAVDGEPLGAVAVVAAAVVEGVAVPRVVRT